MEYFTNGAKISVVWLDGVSWKKKPNFPKTLGKEVSCAFFHLCIDTIVQCSEKWGFAIQGLPFLISSTRQELFAKVLECCFSFANQFCIRKFIFLLGNVPFVRGLRPCFIKLFQSDSDFSLSRVNFPIYLPLLLGFIKPLSLCSEQNFSHKI